MSEPEELDPALREYVDAFIEETSVSAARTEAALSELSNGIGSTGGSASTANAIGSAAKIGAAVLVAAVAGAVLWPRPEAAAPAPTVSSQPRRAPDEVDAPAPPPDEPSAIAAGEDTPAIAAPSEPLPEPPSTRAKSTTETDDPPSPSRSPAVRRAPPEPETPEGELQTPRPEAGHELADELELMRAARAALRSGRSDRALSLLREHARAYPDSPFAEERQATEILALCKQGDVAEAEAKAQRFRAAFSASAFGPDLLEACDPS